MSDVTQILIAIESGESQAAELLLPLVYDELRRLAAAQMANEKLGHTLDATGLVHEAYLRLVANPDHQVEGAKPQAAWANRRHFFAAAAEAMRRILIDNARSKRRIKRGGGMKRVELPDAIPNPDDQAEELLALDEAFEQLAREEPQIAELVKLRYFAGMTIPDAAEILGIAPRTASVWWTYARTWLKAKIRGEDV